MERLPQEIVDHIVSYLDTEPPSERHLFDKPSMQFFYSDLQPLKCISLTSQRFRKPAAKLLFKHAVIDAGRDSPELISTLRKLEIKIDQVHSILIHNNPFADHPGSELQIQWELDMALELLNPIVVTLAVSPTKLIAIMKSHCPLSDAWAFQIPFQVLRLETDKGSSDNVRQMPPNLLQARPWAQVTFNEGSSTPAYSGYEYFALRAPSWIINTWYPSRCFQNLTVFELIAVFPFAIRTRLDILYFMPGLRILRVQLAPSLRHPSASQNDIKEAKLIHDNHKDMWMELQTDFNYLANRVEDNWKSWPLSTVDFLDYRNDALKGMIEEAVHGRMVSWTQRGECSWIKENTTNNSGSSSASAQA